MANIVDIYEAKMHLSKLIKRAAGGEEIIIARAGVPQARLVPLPTGRKPREPGGWEGEVWIAEDFDDPLPAEILRGFTGSDPDGGSPPQCHRSS